VESVIEALETRVHWVPDRYRVALVIGAVAAWWPRTAMAGRGHDTARCSSS
jgi:hypothetical protein